MPAWSWVWQEQGRAQRGISVGNAVKADAHSLSSRSPAAEGGRPAGGGTPSVRRAVRSRGSNRGSALHVRWRVLRG